MPSVGWCYHHLHYGVVHLRSGNHLDSSPKRFGGSAIKSSARASGAASAVSFIVIIFSFAIFIAAYIGIFTLRFWSKPSAPRRIARRKSSCLEACIHRYRTGGFGKFLLVLDGLGSIVVSNNIPNNYPFALHAQNSGRRAVRAPRITFVTFGFVAAITVGCCLRKHSANLTFNNFDAWDKIDVHLRLLGSGFGNEGCLKYRRQYWT
ncbi:uncharacterized protein BDR25DRAFT_358584 [Lindgomyces ingoldianus]|uniref:Uncharacterized protein n=1 Tax=Lindgomyces ingoldianus TaxID=673940 RepID=A0ACB6QKR8_9PLEO|nr:uncharacterized protein BDR25DRAFT_358584 [Lindgomyces ingoldianus]KAF2467471.1 hypothetical protein BDR25DRAFT_358584 [Lindgomyces ingoldianus]